MYINVHPQTPTNPADQNSSDKTNLWVYSFTKATVCVITTYEENKKIIIIFLKKNLPGFKLTVSFLLAKDFRHYAISAHL